MDAISIEEFQASQHKLNEELSLKMDELGQKLGEFHSSFDKKCKEQHDSFMLMLEMVAAKLDENTNNTSVEMSVEEWLQSREGDGFKSVSSTNYESDIDKIVDQKVAEINLEAEADRIKPENFACKVLDDFPQPIFIPIAEYNLVGRVSNVDSWPNSQAETLPIHVLGNSEYEALGMLNNSMALEFTGLQSFRTELNSNSTVANVGLFSLNAGVKLMDTTMESFLTKSKVVEDAFQVFDEMSDLFSVKPNEELHELTQLTFIAMAGYKAIVKGLDSKNLQNFHLELALNFHKSTEPTFKGLNSFFGNFHSVSMIEEVEFSLLKAGVQLVNDEEVVNKLFDIIPKPFPSFCMNNVLIQPSVIETAGSKSFIEKLFSISTTLFSKWEAVGDKYQMFDGMSKTFSMKPDCVSIQIIIFDKLPNQLSPEQTKRNGKVIMIVFDPGGVSGWYNGCGPFEHNISCHFSKRNGNHNDYDCWFDKLNVELVPAIKNVEIVLLLISMLISPSKIGYKERLKKGIHLPVDNMVRSMKEDAAIVVCDKTTGSKPHEHLITLAQHEAAGYFTWTYDKQTIVYHKLHGQIFSRSGKLLSRQLS